MSKTQVLQRCNARYSVSRIRYTIYATALYVQIGVLLIPEYTYELYVTYHNFVSCFNKRSNYTIQFTPYLENCFFSAHFPIIPPSKARSIVAAIIAGNTQTGVMASIAAAYSADISSIALSMVYSLKTQI